MTSTPEVWADLEGQAHYMSKARDTLCVVTGCVIDGASLPADRLGNSVTVPVAYFRGIPPLQQRQGCRSLFYDFTFWFDHEKYSGSLSSTKPDKDMAISGKDELEKKLGYDILVSLDGKVGERTRPPP